jgi:hypothetical protein
MNIIGLGQAGCNIAEKFTKFPQYKVFQIDVGKEGTRCYNVKKQSGPEDYESNTPSLKKMFSKTKGETLFIIGGSGQISAMSLSSIERT